MKLDRFEVEPLNSENYAIWKQRMQMFLTVKDLWNCILEDRVFEDPQSVAQHDKAKAYIGLSVEKHLYPVVLTANSAKAAWEALQNMFEPKLASRQLYLQRQLLELKMTPPETLEVYMGRSRTLYAELIAVDSPISEHAMVTTMLAGLPERYSDFVTMYVQSDDKLTYAAIQSKLISADQMLSLRETMQPSRETPAFLTPAPVVQPAASNNMHSNH